MARTQTTKQDNGQLRMFSAAVFDDAASPDAFSERLGFRPRYIRVENATDRIVNEWFEGMTTAHAVRTVAAGTRSLETSGGPTVVGDTVGFAVLQNKQYRVVVFG
jgi:hypothetical protein